MTDVDDESMRYTVYTTSEATTALLVTISAGMIYFMQTSFALVENGGVRKKNSSHVLVKNLYGICFGAIAFWLFGFGFAMGLQDGNQFIGLDKKYFGGSGFESHEKDLYLLFLFHFSFAITAATIVSGSLTERT
jgi:Amt family ammonium transporter